MDYLYIRGWHQSSGSMQYYIEQLLRKARYENAPDDAVYYSKDEDRWITLDELHPDARKSLECYVNIHYRDDRK